MKVGAFLQTITYYYSCKEPKKIAQIIENPLFYSLVTYFSCHEEEEILLRKLKKNFPTEKNLELFLEKLISLNLIQRENKRYKQKFPIFSLDHNFELPSIVKRLLDHLILFEKISTTFLLGEWLWFFLFNDNDDYFFGMRSSQSFYKKSVIQNESHSIVSIIQENSKEIDLAIYFTSLAELGGEVPIQYKALEKLIGDVSSDYYLSQIKKIIKYPEKLEKSSRKKNIFIQSLCLTGDLIQIEKEKYSLQTPILKKNDQKQESASLNLLKIELKALWQTIEDINQQQYIKKQIYRSIMNYCGYSDKKRLTYFKC